jgi:RimJ/RimL family protein N-acetyltransferase
MIKGKKVILRLVKEKDLKEFFPLLEKVSFECNGFLPYLIPENLFLKKFQETAFWEKDRGMMIILNKRENIIGAISFKKCEIYHSLDIRYVIFNEEDKGNGYRKEALLLFSNYLFFVKKMNRLQLTIPVQNEEALEIAQKCGYKFEGIARGAFFNRGKYVDLCVYAMLREERMEAKEFHEKDGSKSN